MLGLVNLISYFGKWYKNLKSNRYVKGHYENVSSTIGVEFAYKVAVLKNKTKVKAQIWDTCNYSAIKFYL